MVQISEILNKLKFFECSLKFEDQEEKEQISTALKSLSLLQFKDIKIDYNVKGFTLIEELFPDIGFVPNLKIELEELEIFFSKERVSISFPREKSQRGRLVRRTKERIRLFPSSISLEEEEEKVFSLESINKAELLIKSFFISDILKNIYPQLREISIIFGLELDKKPKITSINTLIEKNFFDKNKFMMENFDFEVEEDNEKYFFAVNLDDPLIKCNFVLQGSNFSIIENKIEELIHKCYEKFNETIDKLKL